MFKNRSLKQKLLFFSFIAIFIPVALLATLSLYTIVKNNIRSNWQYLDRIISLIQTDISSARETYGNLITALAEDDYIKTKVHVHTKYRNYLSTSTLEWDMVPLREYLRTYALKNNIEIIALYELYTTNFQLACSFGNTNFLPLEYKPQDMNEGYTTSRYSQSLNTLFITSRGPVITDERPVGLIVIQKMYDNNFFHSYALKYGVDIIVRLEDKVVFSSLPKNEIQGLLASTETMEDHLSLRLDQRRLAVSKAALSLEQEGFGGSLTLIHKDPISVYQGFRESINLIILSVFSVVFSVSLILIWGVRIVRNINELYLGTEEVSSGNLNYRLPVTEGDELGKLSENFNQMVTAIQEKNSNLENKNKELRIMNYYIDSVLQSLQVNTLVVDRDYRITLINHGAQDILKLEDNLSGKPLFSIGFFQDHEALFTERIQAVFATQEYDFISETELGRNVFSIHLCPIIEAKKDIYGVLMVIINNTERENLKKELLRSQEIATIGQVYAYLAHEINNPITVMLNHIDLLKGKKLNKEEKASFLNRIESETLRIHNLVRNLLQFIKDDKVDTTDCNLVEICRQIVTLLEPMMKQKNILVTCGGSDGAVTVKGNLLMMKQLFLNIVKNAVEAVDSANGHIDISVKAVPGNAVVNIRDNGRGISKYDLERVFEPFYTNKSGANTGLGLSLCKEIAVKHHGSISIESEEGKGTVVTLTFPTVQHEKE